MKPLELLLDETIVAELRVYPGWPSKGVMRPRIEFRAVRSVYAELERAERAELDDDGLDPAASEQLRDRVFALRDQVEALAMRIRDEHGRLFDVEEFVFRGRAFGFVLARRTAAEGFAPGLSERARRMLARGSREQAPDPGLRVLGASVPSAPACAELAECWAGRSYRVRGGVGFEFDSEFPDTVPDRAGHQLLNLGERAGAWLPFWMAADGSVWCGAPLDGCTRYADSVAEMVETDALLDALLDTAPSWSTCGGPPVPVGAELRDALARVAARCGATLVPEASGSVRDAWSGPDLLLLVVPMGGPDDRLHGALQVFARDPAGAVRVMAALDLLGVPLFEQVVLHPLERRFLLRVNLDRELAAHGLLLHRLELDARGFLGALAAAIARALAGPRPELLAEEDPLRRLPELLHAVEVARAFESDLTWNRGRAERLDELARFLAFWSEHDAALHACLNGVVGRRACNPAAPSPSME